MVCQNCDCHHKPAIQSVTLHRPPPKLFKENYTLLYFIPPRSLVINAVGSDAALQTHTEPQWGDCLSASAVSSTSFRSKSTHLQFFSHQRCLEMCCFAFSNSVIQSIYMISFGICTHVVTYGMLIQFLLRQHFITFRNSISNSI